MIKSFNNMTILLYYCELHNMTLVDGATTVSCTVRPSSYGSQQSTVQHICNLVKKCM